MSNCYDNGNNEMNQSDANLIEHIKCMAYKSGYEAGERIGKKISLNEGRKYGYKEGYQTGYRAGFEAATIHEDKERSF